jgi:hypothetical protein
MLINAGTQGTNTNLNLNLNNPNLNQLTSRVECDGIWPHPTAVLGATYELFLLARPSLRSELETL